MNEAIEKLVQEARDEYDVMDSDIDDILRSLAHKVREQTLAEFGIKDDKSNG